MYFVRDVENSLMKWKNTPEHLVAYVQGARQVGKTTLIEHFITNNYKNIIQVKTAEDRIQLERRLECYGSDARTVVTAYAATKGIIYEDNDNTVLFIDEIQESKRIYEFIRFFNRELNCDVIVTGSYLWLAANYFHPVGDVNYFTVYPLSFPEFLNILEVREIYEKVDMTSFNADDLQKLWSLWEAYSAVGGYPAVVKSWLTEGDYLQVLEEISLGIKDEISVRVGDLTDGSKLDDIFRSVLQIASQNKRGDSRLIDTLSKITANYETGRINTKELYSMIAWVHKAGFVQYADKHNLENGEIKSREKLYFTDLGMLTYMCKKFAIPDSTYSGMLAETFVFKILSEQGIQPEFGIFGDYELDFVVRRGLNLYGVEVKMNNDIGASITEANRRKLITDVVYFKKSGYGNVDNVTTVPLPLAWRFQFEEKNSSIYDTPSVSTIKDVAKEIKVKTLDAF